MSVEISGIDEIKKNLSRINDKFFDAFDKAVVATAGDIQRDAVLSINNVTRGYKQVPSAGNKNKLHDVSAPGQPPNTDTGKLVSSIAISHIKGAAIAYVYTDLDYGASLELVKNRPWLRPAFNKNVKSLAENIAGQLVRANIK